MEPGMPRDKSRGPKPLRKPLRQMYASPTQDYVFTGKVLWEQVASHVHELRAEISSPSLKVTTSRPTGWEVWYCVGPAGDQYIALYRKVPEGGTSNSVKEAQDYCEVCYRLNPLSPEDA